MADKAQQEQQEKGVKRILAIPAVATAIPVNPRTAAMSATTKKASAMRSIANSLFQSVQRAT
jgi:hypothetical protein